MERAVEFDELRAACSVRRRLALSPRAGSRALLRMRREGELQRRWTLGDLGSFELEADLVEISTPSRTHSGSIHLPARLWDPDGSTMTGVDVDVRAAGASHVEIELMPAQRLPEWFRGHDLEHWSALAQAALDELCEEMLWHAAADAREQEERARAS